MIRSVQLEFDVSKEHQRIAKRTLQSGLMLNGVSVAKQKADCVATWKGNPRQYSDVPLLIMECGYINGQSNHYINDRLRFISMSWNKRHGWSDWEWPEQVPTDRWDQLNIELQPWRTKGHYVLLLEQHPGDSAAPNVAEFRADITRHCDNRDWPLRVRHHPTYISNERTLQEDLADARLAITWASTASVEAVIAGVPTYAIGPGSIASPVTASSLSDEPYTGDREEWAHKLAYRQWTWNEIADGSAWPHIESGLTGKVVS